ncbi:MAG: hypothetical protein GX496_03300, partial [Firmicutes bacterium]|nr:hypothetical protein [Bacillota bacterium]
MSRGSQDDTTPREWRRLSPDERALMASITGDEAWRLVERFATLVRESGSEDAR